MTGTTIIRCIGGDDNKTSVYIAFVHGRYFQGIIENVVVISCQSVLTGECCPEFGLPDGVYGIDTVFRRHGYRSVYVEIVAVGAVGLDVEEVFHLLLYIL